MARTSQREIQFADLWRRFGPGDRLPLKPQHPFHPTRKWSFDFAHVATCVAIEIDGVVWFGKRKSAHQTANGIDGDNEKRNAAIELGWVVLVYTQRDLDRRPLNVLEQVQRVIERRLASRL